MSKSLRRTEEAAKLLSKVLVCAECKERSDELQFIGTVCRHAFCWSCINTFSRNSQTICDLCKNMIEPSRPNPALIVNQVIEKMDQFHGLLAKYREAVDREGSPLATATQRVAQQLFIIENEPRRNIDDFMLTQRNSLTTSDETPNNSPPKLARRRRSTSKENILNDENRPPSSAQRFADAIMKDEDMSKTESTPVTSKRNRPIFIKKETTVPMLFQTQEMMQGGIQLPLMPPPNVPTASKTARAFEFTKKPDRIFGEERVSLPLVFARNSSPVPRSPSLEYQPTTPNTTAVREEFPETLERKAFRKSLVYRKGNYDVIEAVLNNKVDDLERLLKTGSDVNETNEYQCTPLYFAAMHGKLNLCKVLVEHGALINAQCGRACDTPLHAAVKHQKEDVVDYLLSKGASKSIRNLHMKIPLEVAAVMSPVRRLVERYVGRPMQPRIPAKLPDKFVVFVLDSNSSSKREKRPMPELEAFKNIITVEDKLVKTVTHVVVHPNEDGSDAYQVDIIFIEAMLRGLTVVSLDWLIDCVEKEQIIRDTTNYEIKKVRFRSLEPVIGTCKAYRLDRQQLKPRLLHGCIVFPSSPHFTSYGKSSFINDVLKLAGAEVILKEPKLNKEDPPPYYRPDLKTPYFILYEADHKLSEKILASSNLHKVSPLWLFDSLTRHQLLDPY